MDRNTQDRLLDQVSNSIPNLSISIFGFDKIFHAILVRHVTALYTEAEVASISANENIKKKFSYHYFQFLVPGALYVAIPIALLATIFNAGIGLSAIVISAVGTVAAWYRWRNVLRANKAVTINQEK
jgi:hypothetical protein